MSTVIEAVARELGLEHEAAQDWLRGLAASGPGPRPAQLPAPDRAAELLAELDVNEEDAAEAVAALPATGGGAATRWVLDRLHHRLVSGTGQHPGTVADPCLPTAPWFYVHLFLATVPAVRAHLSRHGVPETVVRATLAQLGEMTAIHRRKHGIGGMSTQDWMTLHLRGVILRLGRLQFEMRHRNGEPVLGVHIPERGGPLLPEECEASFARARPFFARHFPDHGATRAVCSSWLLDPQLARYLPESANIVRFGQRWTLEKEGTRDGDRSVLEFVFRCTDQPLDALPRDTLLRRTVLEHLEAGRHWQVCTGWTGLP